MSEPLTVLRIGGVPEHFNVPWWLAMENNLFTPAGIHLEWHECAGGTGEMMRGLVQGELDLAIALSEGTVAAIAAGTPAAIVQWYVQSPLLWGIHVAAGSRFDSTDQLCGARFAISRPGSGSHLMSFVEAQRQGWLQPNTDYQQALRFVEVGNLQGGIEALREDRADAFMWEQYTTQPWVDQGVFRRIGVCPTPWPAFALVAHTGLPTATRKKVLALMAIMNRFAPAFKAQSDASHIIAERCRLPIEQVKLWLQDTQWAQDSVVQKSDLNIIIQTLTQLKLLQHPVTMDDIVLASQSISDD